MSNGLHLILQSPPPLLQILYRPVEGRTALQPFGGCEMLLPLVLEGCQFLLMRIALIGVIPEGSPLLLQLLLLGDVLEGAFLDLLPPG